MYRRPVIRYQHMASIMYSPNYHPKISVGRQNHFGLSHQSKMSPAGPILAAKTGTSVPVLAPL